MKRHLRDNYLIIGEGIYGEESGTEDGKPYEHRQVVHPPSTTAEVRKFQFSRLGPKGRKQLDLDLLEKLANAMTAAGPGGPDANVDAGFTYLGQFVDHDLTADKTRKALGEDVTVAQLLQGRSPALDLDCLYGMGPHHADDRHSYAADGIRLKVGTTAKVAFPDQGTNVDLEGFDLPRNGAGGSKAERIKALIPDHRNDENLAVAQTHLAFIRFHNAVVARLEAAGTTSATLFERAREQVVKHYQWMLRTDFLPHIVEDGIVDEVWHDGRRWVEPNPYTGDYPTMPIEFSVAAYRLGHSMIRSAYDWNRVFGFPSAPGGPGGLDQLFRFSGTSGNLSPAPSDPDNPGSGSFEQLPTNWIADFRRLYDFGTLVPAGPGVNKAKRIDTALVDPLDLLPLGSFQERGLPAPANDRERNLAFRNLVRARMVSLASGQQMAEMLEAKPLTENEIVDGNGGASLAGLTTAERDVIVADTPLWFYVLREAEVGGGKMGQVGGRIVAEVFHRAMEGSRYSIVRDPAWRPTLGPDPDTFRMVDLLLAMCADPNNPTELNPLG